MKMRNLLVSTLLAALVLAPVARADPPTSVQVEVNFLLGYIDGSGCEFYRNGTWHTSQVAQAHLRDKYNYLAARNMINTTEQFIERAATQSSLSGQAYEVRCSGGAAVSSNQWMREKLAHFRAL